MVAKAMVHDPDILILDEPTAGVDIELRQQLWDNVKILNSEGKTILLTTHYLEEAEAMCDRIAIINNGRVIADENKDDLLSRIEGKEIMFRMDRDLSTIPGELSEYTARLDGKRKIIVTYRPSDTDVQALIGRVNATGMTITDISTHQSDLEDVFLQLTRAA